MNPRTFIAATWALALIPAVHGADEALDQASPSDSPPKQERRYIEIAPNDQIPTVRAILPIGGPNAFFLNHRGQIGVAKFSPGLSQIGWELYSEVKLHALPSLALGPGYSVIAASPLELTQAFDTNQDVELDFFQALVRDWPGQSEGVTITAGPVIDTHGRVLFALSPHALKDGDVAKARIVAWQPDRTEIETVTESELPVEDFVVRRDGLLAARLSMPDYKDGYFLSLTELPPPLPENSETPAGPLPFTLPSLIIPAELTGHALPIQPTFFEEDGKGKLLLTCPESRHLIEIVPEKAGGLWQGAILLRGRSPKPVYALAEMEPGAILGGGDEGFLPLNDSDPSYRILSAALANDGLLLRFNQPVDRYSAVKAENYSVKAIALGGGETSLSLEPLIESDGKTVLLRGQLPGPGNVLRI
ncbi:MAG: hypothetical protein KDN18_24070, partial [Verrucomicrobiae bacterium]|nr:hypothetical protein [Verrucomicrobiae bacterium]